MMQADSSTSRLRGAFSIEHGETLPAGGCPDPGRIWDAVHGRLQPKDVRALVEHVALCASCAADWRIAMSDAEPIASRARTSTRWIAAAAAVLVIAGLAAGWRLLSSTSPEEPVYRDTSPAIRSLVPDRQPLARTAAVLRWTSPGPGAVFSVEIGRPDLTPLASARELRDPEYPIPAAALHGVEPGGTIVWRVEARLPDGRRIESSAFLNTVP